MNNINLIWSSDLTASKRFPYDLSSCYENKKGTKISLQEGGFYKFK